MVSKFTMELRETAKGSFKPDWSACDNFARPSQVYIYVVEKSTGKVLPVVYASEPFFFFHVINAFQVDVDKYIYIDIMAYSDAKVGDIYTSSYLVVTIQGDTASINGNSPQCCPSELL